MKFVETRLRGAFVVELDELADERGFFARSFCEADFAARGIPFRVVQSNVCYNRRKGTLRGMHFQRPPHAEAKLVRCTRGVIWDVIVDLRPGSPSFGAWDAVELSSQNRKALYIPERFAQGFQSLTDDTELVYLMSETYHPESADGVRWDDPRLNIPWPIAEPVLSERDRRLPYLAG